MTESRIATPIGGQMTPAGMLKLKRWNSPTIYNGWEMICATDRTQGTTNLEETRDFMPMLGPMVGRAVTVKIETTNRNNLTQRKSAWDDWLQFVSELPGPKIVVMQDIDVQPGIGSFWGEVSANMHRSLGCVGAIIDGAIRDVDEMTNAGFKAIARRLCVGHLYAWPVEWGTSVRVFGATVDTGMLMHADKHGFIGIETGNESALLDAVRAMDDNECNTVIPAARFTWNKDFATVLHERQQANARFRSASAQIGNGSAEW